jgi:hypothetical protein
LFKEKLRAEKLGLQLQTVSASDYSPDQKYMTDNVYTRWIKFRCTVQNTWKQLEGTVNDIEVKVDFDSIVEHEQ